MNIFFSEKSYSYKNGYIHVNHMIPSVIQKITYLAGCLCNFVNQFQCRQNCETIVGQYLCLCLTIYLKQNKSKENKIREPTDI